MGLDIDTPKGQATLEDVKRVQAIVAATWPGIDYVRTIEKSTAAVDALLVRDGNLVAVAEVKCRYDMDLDMLVKVRGNEWLVTHDKILKGREVADLLQVPFWGLLYLKKDDLLLRIKIYDHKAGWLAKLVVDNTMTQKTINGGTAYRSNAFIHMAKADMLRA